MSAGSVSLLLVLPAIAQARKQGVAVEDLLAAHGLTPAVLADPDARIPFEASVQVWDELARRAASADFGLVAARELPAGYFDLHEYLVRCSPTLGAGLRHAFRFLRLLSSRGHFEVELAGDEMRIVNRPPGLTSRHGHEFALSALYRIARRAAGRAIPLVRLELMSTEPPDTAGLREAFGCPLGFGQPANVLVFARALDAFVLPAHDERLLALIERHARAMSSALGDETAPLRDRVRRAIFQLFQRETMSLARVARVIGTSERSLQRDLRREQTSFRELVDEVRREIAIAHVTEGRLPITAIALLLDFSDASSFHRSFRRWTGQAPSQLRAASRS